LAQAQILNKEHQDILSSREITGLEEALEEASDHELPKLESKIARQLQLNPGSHQAIYLMSKLLLKMFSNDPGSFLLLKQSSELAAQAYELKSSDDMGIAALAGILDITGEPERGLALLNEAEARGIKLGWRGKLARAKILLNIDSPEAVLSLLKDALKDPRSSHLVISSTLIKAISTHFEGLEQVEQLKLWRKICQSYTMDLALAGSYAINNQFKDAITLYSDILVGHPQNFEALFNQGVVALRLKDAELAVKSFLSASGYAKSPSEKSMAQTNLALALISSQRKLDVAKVVAYEAIKGATDSESVLVGIVSAFRRETSVSSTLAFLEGLETSVPGLHLGYALKAELLSEKLGRHYDAMQSFTNAIALEPGRSEYYNGRGLAWMGIGRIDIALGDFESATFANPDDASARYNVACALARLGRKDDALASLGMAFAMDERLMSHARTDQDLRSLHRDPSFESLLNPGPKTTTVAH
jgi:tetratricopeptide (TPR) repeat protein